MKIIKYSYNFNGKLNPKVLSWSTVRLKNDYIYREGEWYMHVLYDHKGSIVLQKKGLLLYNHDFLLDKVTLPIARLDTGYGVDEFIAMVRKMYKNKNIDWTKKLLSFLVFTQKF